MADTNEVELEAEVARLTEACRTQAAENERLRGQLRDATDMWGQHAKAEKLHAEVERLRAEVARLTDALAEREADEAALVEALMARRLPSVERTDGLLARGDALLAKYGAIVKALPLTEGDRAISARLLGDPRPDAPEWLERRLDDALRPGRERALSRPAQLSEPDNAGEACNTCEHAVSRFNGGRGATTCDLLGDRIVATGPGLPTVRPSECPLPEPPVWERKPVTHEWAHMPLTTRAWQLRGWEVGPGELWWRGDVPVSRPIQPSEREESNR